MLLQSGHRIEHPSNDEARGLRVVYRDVGGFIVEIAQGLPQPPKPHSLPTSWRRQ